MAQSIKFKQSVYHYHNHRTGGTSINFAFFSLVGDPMSLYLKQCDDPRKQLVASGLRFAGGCDKVISSGNFDYAAAHDSCEVVYPPVAAFTFTVMRDPLSRWNSLYNLIFRYINEGSKRPEIKWVDGKHTLFDFVCGLEPQNSFHQLYKFSTKLDVSSACSVIRQRCKEVFLFEQREHTIETLSKVIGHALPMLHENRTQGPGGNYKYKPSVSDIKQLEHSFAPEYDFYHRVCDELKR